MILSADSTPPPWADQAQAVLDDAGLSILRQEKERPAARTAWWTCDDCPQRYRWLEGRVWYNFSPGGYAYPVKWTRGNEWTAIGLVGDQAGLEWLTVKRCRRCMRQRDRHHRMVASLKAVLEEQMTRMGTSARFVTLTVPNETIAVHDGVVDPMDLVRLVRELKTKMYNFSRTKAYKEHVLGAVEVYEQTYTIASDQVEVNTHIHAVWLGQFWKQADLQEKWDGITHISKPRSRRAVLRYISKYVTKDPVPGTRAKETRGVLRGE